MLCLICPEAAQLTDRGLARAGLLPQNKGQRKSGADIVVSGLCLGVDGGGSGCRAAVCDAQGHILGLGLGGPANATSDLDATCTHLADAIAQAMCAAGSEMDHVAAGFLGIAGMRKPQQARAISERLGLIRCTVTEDRPSMIAGALGGRDGAVAALGTGSFVGLSRGADVRAIGGWGMQLSDQAGAAWIGRAGLTATLEAVDGMQAVGTMAQAMLLRWNGDPDGIVDFTAAARPADYGALAPIVTAAAQNDPSAASIMAQAAAWIDRALLALGHDDSLPLVMTAGLGTALQPWLAREGRRFVAPAGTALDGALSLARRAAWG